MTDEESVCSYNTNTSQSSSLVSKLSNMVSSISSTTPLFKFISYDPFCHQNHLYVYSSYLSIVFIVCRSVGLGFLCMPHAFQQVGAVVGLALCVFAGLTFNYSYTLLNLIENSLALGPRVISSFSKYFKFLFLSMNLSLNFGTSCLYTIFVSAAIQELFGKMSVPMKQIDGCLFYMIVYLALLLVPSVKYLEPLKIIGQITCTAVLLCYFYSRMYSTDIKIDNHSLFSGEWREVFYFFGILLFSFVPVVQLLKIEDQLIKPEDFVQGPSFGLLYISMIIVTNMYISVGLWGYLAFDHIPKIGYTVLAVIPASRILNFTKMCFVAHTMLSHQELCSGTMAMLWSSSIAKADEEIKNNDDETCAYLFMTDQYSFSDISWLVAATKIVFTSGSFLVAVVLLTPWPSVGNDHLELAMALLGYAGNAWNVLVYPYVIELCLTHALHGVSARPYAIAKDAFFVVFGLAVSSVGVYAVITRSVQRTPPPGHCKDGI